MKISFMIRTSNFVSVPPIYLAILSTVKFLLSLIHLKNVCVLKVKFIVLIVFFNNKQKHMCQIPMVSCCSSIVDVSLTFITARVETIGGGDTMGYLDGDMKTALFNHVEKIIFWPAGNSFLFLDKGNFRIRNLENSMN